jgi:hypothetical protein
MVVEEFVNFGQWIGSALGVFALLALAAIVLGLFFGYLVASFRHGPFEAFYIVSGVCAQAIPDFLGTSLRRVLAIARLAIKEALRRRIVLVTFGIFALALLFGGWFMNSGSDHPDRIYVNFVLWGTQLLVLMMGLLISAFSLPDDIKKKTIYTIVTKPVRATEIVIGRIVGFGALGTALLALMGLISFLFVWGGLSHEHQIAGDTNTLAEFTDVDPSLNTKETGRRVSPNAVAEAYTGFNSGHRHRLEIRKEIRDPDNPPKFMDNVIDSRTETRVDGKVIYQRVFVEPAAGHRHAAFVSDGENPEITLGPAYGYFRARVPKYGDYVQFYDRKGEPSRGIDVGREWRYRGYVDGGSLSQRNSLAKASFHFQGFTEGSFQNPEVLPLEMTLGIFRTYKGNIEKRVVGSLQIKSSVSEGSGEYRFESDPIDFETNEFTLQTLPISRKQPGRKLDSKGNLVEKGDFDLFDDYAANGDFDLELRCIDKNQYIGVARADLYFRSRDNPYWLNFIKGYLGIWCQMMIIIAMGVAFSTFLSAPVVMLSSVVAVIVGFCTPFIRTLTMPDADGGGPIESFYRLITQKNTQIELQTGIATTLMEQLDYFLVLCLNSLTYIVPNFAQLNFSDFLTYGYSVNNDRLFVALAIACAFCIGLSVLGYFCLKTREIAK